MADLNLNGPLSLREACEVIGWKDEAGKVRPSHLRRLRRRLRRDEKRTGQRYVFGGGKPGAEYWTTLRALNEVKLVAADLRLIAEAQRGMEAIHEQIQELKDTLNDRMDIMTEQILDNTREITNAKRRRTAGFAD